MRTVETGDNHMRFHDGIRIDKIPARGAGGFIFALSTVAIFALGIPEVRQLLLVTLPGGVIFAALLNYWHNQTRW
jgi:hypothetical protein